MKFGLFFNPVIPRRSETQDWDPGQERQAFLNLIEQVQFADSLGFDYVFLGEHHFTPEYAHNSAPEVLLGALASTTSRIRIGTSIIHASHNDPIRTAERIATIDQISGGRAEFGFGGGGDAEIAPFLHPELRARRRELAAVSAAITVDVLSHSGFWPGVKNEFFEYPGLNVIPKSYQRPHPPLWTSTMMPGQIASVAERGLGAMMLAGGAFDAIAADIETYWATLRRGEVTPIGLGINPAVFVFVNCLVAPTDPLARERLHPSLEFFGFGLTGGAFAGTSDPEHHLWNAFLDFKAGRRDIREDVPFPPPMRQLMLELGRTFANAPNSVMGSPCTVAEYARLVERTNADAFIQRYDFGIPHEHAMESLQLMAAEVIPEFRDREHDHAAWRGEQLDQIHLPVVTSL